MYNLYNRQDVEGILLRISRLQPDAPRQWGKMTVSQMLAHCTLSLETAMGRNFPKRVFIGRILGPLLKPGMLSAQPMPQNARTDKSHIISAEPDFDQAKAKVQELIRAFYNAGPAACTRHPQAFYGKMNAEGYAIMQWKHFDHHLRQFAA